MEDLIKALQIFSKYTNDDFPTFTTHDTFHVNVRSDTVSPEDLVELEKLSFMPDNEFDCFLSYRFGSC